MLPQEEDELGALEKTRERLYSTHEVGAQARPALSVSGDRVVQHTWADEPVVAVADAPVAPPPGKHMRYASLFLSFAALFFIVSVGIATYLLYFGGNTVSTDKVAIQVQGPTTIAGGDTVPLALTIVNQNPTAIDNAQLEVTFPDGARDASNTLEAYPRYVEELGHLESGETVTRTVRAVLFGGANQTLTVPISVSYRTAGSNAVFVKKSSYPINISTSPLELTVGSLTETVSGKPITLTLTVRSNAPVPTNNVILSSILPFGFTVVRSSEPLVGSSVLIGTLAPGATKVVTITGTLEGQQGENKAFRFSVGTARAAGEQSLAVTYMSQDATVALSAPFINTSLKINGEDAAVTVPAGARQSVSVSYANTLDTNVSNVQVAVAIEGTAVDYKSVETSRGFYRSADRTVLFSQDKDPGLASLAPGDKGVGSFTFSTLPSGAAMSPTITLTISVSGTRVGQSNVPEQVQASFTKTLKVITAVSLVAQTAHSSGPIANTGPIPPKADQATTYSVLWTIKNPGSAIAEGVVTATLPSYVSYTGKTAGTGSFVYDPTSRKVTWTAGNVPAAGATQGVFQVSIVPSISQRNNAPALTTAPSFTGFDRFAGVSVKASGGAVTTEAKADPGYTAASGVVGQ